ncbi:MAG: TrmH family RNA methyltransferase [Candidatus Cryptobacteroides sp.]
MEIPVSSNEIKYVKSLTQKKYRDQENAFIVEGEKMVAEALESSFDILKVYTLDSVGAKAMSRLSQMATPSPALAVVRKPANLFLDATSPLPLKGLFLALDGIRDPGNLGTIIRLADWFGIDAVFASGDTVDIFNPKVVQSTMGAIFRVPYRCCDLPLLLGRMRSCGADVYGTFLDGENMYSMDLCSGADSPSVIVIGNEANGISPAAAAEVTRRLFIPPYPEDCRGSESLNAAVATAVTVAEFRRRQAMKR